MANNECGELVLQKLFLDFVHSADRRIESSIQVGFSNFSLYSQLQLLDTAKTTIMAVFSRNMASLTKF